MKVGMCNPVLFRSSKHITKPDEQRTNSNNIMELSNVTPDFAVKIPQQYKKLGEHDFANGLKLHSYKLSNGLKVSIIPIEGASATVKSYVNIGSMNEPDDIKGISHFLEHMAFNGTIGNNGYIKLNSGDTFKKIDKLGGWTNASTSYATTDYVNSTPLLNEKDIEEQIKIIAAMNENLALTSEMIEKEKGPVCSEINMILDDPMTIANDQTVRTLFNIKSSADELIAGSTEHIKNLNYQKVKDYYDKHYVPENMNIVITGDVDPNKIIEIVAKNFHSTKKAKDKFHKERLIPIEKTIRKDFLSDKTNTTYATIGFAGPKDCDTKDKIITEILYSYIPQTDVGITKELKKINADFTIGCCKISNNTQDPTFTYYTLESADKNSEKALKIIFDKLSNLKAPSKEKLDNIKEEILDSYKNSCEYSLFINNIVGDAVLRNDLDGIINYEKYINSITTEDVQKYIDKYINVNKAAVTVVHPTTTINEINKNYAEASRINFKGKRQPLNKEKVSEKTLNNNYKAVFHETNNDNISFYITLDYPFAKNMNPAALKIYQKMLDMGTAYRDEDSFNKYMEENNINTAVVTGKTRTTVYGFSNYKNFDKAFSSAKELLYSPRITEENFKLAKEQLIDLVSRIEDNANTVYIDNEAKINPLYTSKEQLINGLKEITIEDIKTLHQYILNNSCGNIVINNPKNNNIKDIAIKNFETLAKVQPHTIHTSKVFIGNDKVRINTKEKSVTQADIMETFKFEIDNSPKERAMMKILDTLLTSSSIGLFTVLREKEQLAYKVSTSTKKIGNTGELKCQILTSTDDKEKEVTTYENLQKSINGFNRQIGALLNSDFTDEDLENAKKIYKAELLINESTSSKLSLIRTSMDKPEGIDYINNVYEEIDNITREDICDFARKVFKYPPTYSIVASKNTLDFNKEYLQNLQK